jgi:hypothetical protein
MIAFAKAGIAGPGAKRRVEALVAQPHLIVHRHTSRDGAAAGLGAFLPVVHIVLLERVGRLKARTPANRSRLGESGRHLGHEPRHFVLYLRMWLQPDIEIEDDLVEPDSLDFFQYFSNLRRASE